MDSDTKIHLQSQLSHREEIIRHLHITLSNTIKLLESIMKNVPSQVEWSGMLDGLQRQFDVAEKLLKDLRIHSSKE